MKRKPFLSYSFRVEPLFFTRGRFMFFLRIRKKICQRPLQLGNRTENDKTLTSSIKQNTPKDRKVKNNHFAQKRNLCGILMFSNGNSCVYYLTTAQVLEKEPILGFWTIRIKGFFFQLFWKRNKARYMTIQLRIFFGRSSNVKTSCNSKMWQTNQPTDEPTQ